MQFSLQPVINKHDFQFPGIRWSKPLTDSLTQNLVKQEMTMKKAIKSNIIKGKQ